MKIVVDTSVIVQNLVACAKSMGIQVKEVG
jgi:hypothetical protein